MGFLSRQPNSNEPDNLGQDIIAKALGSAYKPEPKQPTCPLCGNPSYRGEVHHDCACREQFLADQMPSKDLS